MSEEKAVELSVENLQALASIQQFAGDAAMRSVGSYEEALALAEAVHGSVIDIAEELGTGFALLEDKGKLEDVEFVLLQWRFNAGDFGGGFVSAGLVTVTGDKYIINDGGTGICAQLMELTQETKRFGGVKVPKGLRKSEYPTCPQCGKPMSRDEIECSNAVCDFEGDKRGQGTTYYLDLSASAN
jgi:hypothetical protein